MKLMLQRRAKKVFNPTVGEIIRNIVYSGSDASTGKVVPKERKEDGKKTNKI